MFSRRELFAASGGAIAAAGTLGTPIGNPAAAAGVKAIGFDAFTIFDPRSITAEIEMEFPGKGEELGAAWRTKAFEYCWLRTLCRNYADFWRIAEDSLSVVFAMAKLELSVAKRAALMEAWLRLKPWPDSIAALESMRAAGLRLAYLSNLTPAILETITARAGVASLFEHQLSTDRIAAYKPDPRAYAMAEAAFDLPRQSILFAAFGGWDAAGAKAFGFETFWVNRFRSPGEELGAQPDAIGGTLADLAKYASR